MQQPRIDAVFRPDFVTVNGVKNGPALGYQVRLVGDAIPDAEDVLANMVRDMFGDDSSDDSDDEGVTSNATKGKDDKSAILIRKPRKPISGDNEFIVYDTKQIKLKYLIEVTTPDWVKKEFKNV